MDINDEISPVKLAAILGISLVVAKRLWSKAKKSKRQQKYGKHSKSWSNITSDIAEGPWQLKGGL